VSDQNAFGLMARDGVYSICHGFASCWNMRQEYERNATASRPIVRTYRQTWDVADSTIGGGGSLDLSVLIDPCAFGIMFVHSVGDAN